MNGAKTTDTNFVDDILGSALGELDSAAKLLMHPDDVLSDRRLTDAQKREVLASWASDLRAVPDAPALQQLDNGAVVRVDDVLRALRFLDGIQHGETDRLSRPSARQDIRVPARLRWIFRRPRSDDDDDPPPCPAVAIRPRLNGPLSNGEAVYPGVALAA
jgi:hypothetical protein